MIRSLDGKMPKVHPEAFVSEFAYVVGDVYIGKWSSIWPGVVIRADAGKIEIGENTNIQDNSVVHGDADVHIGNNVVIGHRVMCHAKQIDDHVLIGNGATVNDGVMIGEYSLLASGTVIVDGVKIPPKSLVVGVPGKRIATVKERHIELINRTAEHYVNNGKRYKNQGNLEQDTL